MAWYSRRYSSGDSTTATRLSTIRSWLPNLCESRSSSISKLESMANEITQGCHSTGTLVERMGGISTTTSGGPPDLVLSNG